MATSLATQSLASDRRGQHPPDDAPDLTSGHAIWGDWSVRCAVGAPSACVGGFGPGAEVRVVATYQVPVARLPFLGAVAAPSLRVGATHRTRVDRYRGFGG
jgi:hypothetical protein